MDSMNKGEQIIYKKMYEMEEIPKLIFYLASYDMNLCIVGDQENNIYIIDLENLRCIE